MISGVSAMGSKITFQIPSVLSLAQIQNVQQYRYEVYIVLFKTSNMKQFVVRYVQPSRIDKKNHPPSKELTK